MPRLDGIDVSNWQYNAGPVDWRRVVAGGVTWGAMKATQSTRYVDPYLTRARHEMAATPELRHRGFYHWISPSTDPIEQAKHFLTALGGKLDRGEFAMLDVEEDGVTVEMCVTWLDYIESKVGRPAVVYTGAYVDHGRMWRDPRIRASIFGYPRPMILAAYVSERSAKTLSDFARYPWQSWQYSGSLPVPGVVGPCDANQIDDVDAYDIAALLHDFGTGIHPLPTDPPPDPKPAPPPDQEDDDMPITFAIDSPDRNPAIVCHDGAGVSMIGLPGGTEGEKLLAAYKITGTVEVSNVVWDDYQAHDRHTTRS